MIKNTVMMAHQSSVYHEEIFILCFWALSLIKQINKSDQQLNIALMQLYLIKAKYYFINL